MTRVLARYGLLITISVIFLAPFAVAALAAAMTDRQIGTNSVWPHPFRWANFADAFRSQPLLHMAVNTATIALFSVVGVLLSSIPAAYALARVRWRGRGLAMVLIMTAFLLPGQVTAIPLYVEFAHLGWVGTFLPLIVPSFLGDAFSIFLLRQFFLTIPQPLLDAYRLEGAGEWRLMTRVAVPLIRPGIAAVALLNVISTWNDFFNPYLYVGQKPDLWTLSIGLDQYRGTHNVDWNLTLAASLVVCLPLIVIFLLSQRALTDAVAAQVPAT
jgi:multiple sugar transport system permease protein